MSRSSKGFKPGACVSALRKVGLYPRSLQKIEAGEINVPVTTLDRIRSVLGCEWGALLDKP